MVYPILLAVLQQAAPSAPPAAAVSIPRLEAKAAIDGKLDEPAWSQATRLTGFRQYEPVDGRPAEEQTEVLVWYAPDAIHFGIRAQDSEPDAIRASRADRDNIEGEDHVIIYLDTFNDRRRAFLFGVNALGVQSDGVRTEGAASAGRIFGGNIDYNPDYLFDSKGQLTPTGYQVEVRIPFKSLRYPSSGPQRWGLQIERKTQRTGYTDTWTDVRRANASYLAQAGTIEGLNNLQRGVVLEAQPFLTASANGLRDPATGRFARDDVSPEVGVNLKLGFTNVALDGTINPDFSQVESDAGQVTINQRFALFFPEKRPFFLEGIELFNTPNQLVYTRQVSDPIGGAKFTGKVGPIGVAHLTAVDENVSGTRDEALFNITRLRRDFGSNSLAGLLVSDRSMLDGNGYNRVIAADTRMVFKRMYFAEFQLGNAWTRDARGSRDGQLWKVTADRTGRRWGFNYSANGISDDFVSQAGFVPRAGIVDTHLFNRFSIYGKPGATLEQFTVFFGPQWIWRYDELIKDGPLEGAESANLSARLRGGWNLQGTLARAFATFEPEFYTGFQVNTPQGPAAYQPLADFSGPNVQVTVTTPTFREVDAYVSVAVAELPIYAEGSEGYGFTTFGGVSLRPTQSIRLGWTGGLQQFYRQRDDDRFARAILSRVKAEYQPTRALFFRAIADYSYEQQAALEDARTGAPILVGSVPFPARTRKALRIDLLTSFEPSPGTVAFLGYGSSMQESPPLLSTLDRVNDGFFFKLAYLFRR